MEARMKCKYCGEPALSKKSMCQVCFGKRLDVVPRKCVKCGTEFDVLLFSEVQRCPDCRTMNRAKTNWTHWTLSVCHCGNNTYHPTGECYKCRGKSNKKAYTPVTDGIVYLKDLGYKNCVNNHFNVPMEYV